MGYEGQPTRESRKLMHVELPDAGEEQRKGQPNGSIFSTEDGRRYRLHYGTAATWREVFTRNRGSKRE
jgi:hypothetical protein